MKKFLIVVIVALIVIVIGLIGYRGLNKSKENQNKVRINNTVTNTSQNGNEVQNTVSMETETSLEIRTALKNRNWLKSKATMESTYLGDKVSDNITWKFMISDSGYSKKIFVLAEDESHSAQIYAIAYEEGKVISTPILDHIADTTKEKIRVDINKGAVECEYTDSGYKTNNYYIYSDGEAAVVGTYGYYPEYGSNGEQTGGYIYYAINAENKISESDYTKAMGEIEKNYSFDDSFNELNVQNIEELIK